MEFSQADGPSRPIFSGEKKFFAWREERWPHPGSTSRIEQRGLRALRTFPNQRSSNAAVTTNGGHARSATTALTATDGWNESSTTWATRDRNDQWISTSGSLSREPCVWSSRTVSPIGQRPGTSGEIIESSSRLRQFRTGSKRREKKGEERIEGDYLDWALSGFSGYIAADELYDGPFCVLSIVDNRQFKRLLYEVLDHDPTHEDILRFFQRFKRILDSRGLKVQGITTDASALYPKPIREIFGDIPHQICEFHVIADLTLSVLRAVAKVRKAIRAEIPPAPRGRPRSGEARKRARAKKRLEAKIAELFEHRHLFVQHHRTAAQARTLRRISRGQPALRTLRDIMDQVYRLFDRRCRTDTALQKLAKLRSRARRFKTVGKKLQKLFSPSVEKALTFLDEDLLPSTSNAVERGNRRHRKMQKTVYRVRAISILRGRVALDMLRDAHAGDRAQTSRCLHLNRAQFG